MLQYRLSTLMILMLVVAILCCLMFSLPAVVAYYVMLFITLLLMPGTLSGIVYGGAGVRAFAIGCAPPVSAVFFWLFGFANSPWLSAGDDILVKIYFIALLVLIGLSGVVSLIVASVCVRRRTGEIAPASRAVEFTGASTDCPTCGQRIAKMSNPRMDDLGYE